MLHVLHCKRERVWFIRTTYSVHVYLLLQVKFPVLVVLMWLPRSGAVKLNQLSELNYYCYRMNTIIRSHESEFCCGREL